MLLFLGSCTFYRYGSCPNIKGKFAFKSNKFGYDILKLKKNGTYKLKVRSFTCMQTIKYKVKESFYSLDSTCMQFKLGQRTCACDTLIFQNQDSLIIGKNGYTLHRLKGIAKISIIFVRAQKARF